MKSGTGKGKKPTPAGTPNQQEDVLLVAVSHPCAFVRIMGRGSFKVSTPLKKFCVALLEKGATHFVFDAEECIGMDSTFMGVLAGIAMRVRSSSPGTVSIINMNDRTQELFSTLGLAELIDTESDEGHEKNAAHMACLAKLEMGDYDEVAASDTVLTAHEDLVKAVPANRPKFQDVLSYLRKNPQNRK